MLNTLFNRLHIVTGSGDLSGLYTEIVDNYNSGNLTQNIGNKGIDELYHRKRVNWHNFDRDLEYLPVESIPSVGLWNWEAGIEFEWEPGISMSTE